MLKDYSSKYMFASHLNDIENDDLGKAHSIYMNLKTSIRDVKNRLLERIDGIYNNFVQPARSHY